MVTPDGWPDLLWSNDLVLSPVMGWDDAELSVEVLLCALSVVPAEDQRSRDLMMAALRARYAKVVRDPRTYEPTRHPWLNRTGPGRNMLQYLSN